MTKKNDEIEVKEEDIKDLDDICDETCLRYRLDHRALVLFSEMVFAKRGNFDKTPQMQV